MTTNDGPYTTEVSLIVDYLTQRLERSSNATMTRRDLYELSIRLNEQKISHHPFQYIIVDIGSPGTDRYMEEQKWGYMNSFLSRSTLAATTGTQGKNGRLKACVQAIAKNEVHLIDDIVHFSDTVKMYLVDGCFIVELLIRYYTIFKLPLRPNYQDFPLFQPVGDQSEDPIFKFNWVLSALRRDLAIIRNQISFDILQILFEVITGRDNNLPHDFLVELVLAFFQPVHQQANPPVPVIDRMLHRAHLLNVLLNIFRPTTEVEAVPICRSSNNRLQPTPRKTIFQTATSLEQVGVKFTPGSTGNLLDIQFHDRQGSFEIPPLQITAWSESFFRNLLAFERCCPDRKSYVASYLLLLNRLINDSEDVRLLEKRGILINNMGSDEDILDMFKSMGRQIDVQEFCYQDLCDKVESSYYTMWNVYKKTLRNDYFRSPWAIICLFFAFIMILLTLIQTIFAVVVYYKLHSRDLSNT